MPCRGVLIVEDDADFAGVIADVIRDLGVPVEIARNGLEGLAALRAMEQPVLVLLDLVMPELSGNGFLREMLADRSLTWNPVVVITATVLEAVPEGSVSVMQKPADLDRIVEVVRRYCGDGAAGIRVAAG